MTTAHDGVVHKKIDSKLADGLIARVESSRTSPLFFETKIDWSHDSVWSLSSWTRRLHIKRLWIEFFDADDVRCYVGDAKIFSNKAKEHTMHLEKVIKIKDREMWNQ